MLMHVTLIEECPLLFLEGLLEMAMEAEHVDTLVEQFQCAVMSSQRP